MLSDLQILRFYDKIASPDQNGCRAWLGWRSSVGYGAYWIPELDNPQYGAHRIALGLATGVDPFTEDRQALHTCDNQLCCEPEHLYWGTIADNMRDKVARVRQARGSRIHNAVLTESQIPEIRKLIAEGLSYWEIGYRYGVSNTAIRFIAIGRTWRHVE